MPDPNPAVEELVRRTVAFVEASVALSKAAAAVPVEALPLEHLLITMLEIRDGLDEGHEAKSTLGEKAHDLMPSRELQIPPYGPFQQFSGWSRKWHNEDVFDALFRKARRDRFADPKTGEIETPEEALLRLIRDCGSINYWRVKALAKVGLSADEYAEWKPGRRGVTLPRKPSG